MKKVIISILFFQLITLSTFAHQGGHGTPNKTWHLSNKDIKADFVKKEGAIVFLSDKNHDIIRFNIAKFTKEDQQYIKEKESVILTLNQSNKKRTFNYHYLFFFSGFTLIFFSVLKFKNQYKTLLSAYGAFALAVTVACNTKASNKQKSILSNLKIPANKVEFLQSIFGSFKKVNTYSDDIYFYIESNGIPEHEMMTGITNWQQQVPINHDYSGKNSWAIPLQPELAEKPLSTKTNFMKGAIAIAVNGLPIFNPLNNRGEDANAIGELDKWGGHCGRADDYHYHLPPTHLQKQVGEGKPIAYALDGFPVYGETSETLDENLGRFTKEGSYQYHTVKEYPYLIGAMRGKVQFNPRTKAPENEIMPQAKTRGIRPDLRPLRGAKITSFKTISPTSYQLNYTVNSEDYSIKYNWNKKNEYAFEFISPTGTRKELYNRK